MASALTGNKIKDSYQALLKMGTNGSLDPTTLITISDGLGNDTPLSLAGDKLSTDYLGDNKGLFLDFVNDDYQFGELLGGSATLGIGVNNAELYGLENVYLSSDQKLYLQVNGVDQVIKTGNQDGEKGLKLDLTNNFYQFGDYTSSNFNGCLRILNDNNYMYSQDNFFSMWGQSLNTWLGNYPGSIYTGDPNANSNNYGFGSDWYMDNNDDKKYPFKYNTVLNCYNNYLDTSDIAMFYSLFANIQDPGFDFLHDINLNNGQSSISNCFIFGLTDYIDSNLLKIYEEKGIPTNVVVLNGTNLQYGNHTSNVFSVNASSVTLDKDNHSGINILGGDFVFHAKLFPANHYTGGDNFGITVQGRSAYVNNNFSYVKAEYFDDYGTSQGQVQVEEFQLFQYYDDGSITNVMVNTLGNFEFYVQNSSSYTVEIKLVSTNGDGDKSSTGNSFTNITYFACVDNVGNVDITDYCEGCHYNPHNALTWDLTFSSSNHIKLAVTPDTFAGNTCYVKAYMTLSCVTQR